MEDKNPPKKANPDKWWGNWWKSNFTDPLNWEAFNFSPFITMLADKLGINSYWGFFKFIVILSIIGIFFRFGLDFLIEQATLTPGNISSSRNNINSPSQSPQINYDSVFSVWINFSELHTMFIVIILLCIVGSLAVWWFYNKDN